MWLHSAADQCREQSAKHGSEDTLNDARRDQPADPGRGSRGGAAGSKACHSQYEGRAPSAPVKPPAGGQDERDGREEVTEDRPLDHDGWRPEGTPDGETAWLRVRSLSAWKLATPTVTKMTSRMEAAGLVERRPHPTDRRLVRICLTERGAGLQEAIGEELRAMTERALRTLGPQQQRQLIRSLLEVHGNLAGYPQPLAKDSEGVKTPLARLGT